MLVRGNLSLQVMEKSLLSLLMLGIVPLRFFVILPRA